MKTLHIIADTDVLSTFAKAERTPGSHSKMEHLAKIYGPQIIVPQEVQSEMLKSTKNPAAVEFAHKISHNLQEGFVEKNPRVVDQSLTKLLPGLRVGHDKGEAHCIGVAEELARGGGSVLILTDDKGAVEDVRQRVQKHGLDISTQGTEAILCQSAEKGLIPNLKQEAAAFHATKVCEFGGDRLRKMGEFHDFIQEKRLEQAHERQQRMDHDQERGR